MLTKIERLLLVNQFKILEKIYPEEADYYSQHREALEAGYVLHYDWLFEQLWDEISKEKCREVIDILSMYRAVTFSERKLDKNDRIDHRFLKFRGFDGNEESQLMAYAEYFVQNLRRFTELKYGSDRADFNSHMPMLDEYRAMLEEWKKCTDINELSREEILRILDAQG